MADLKLALTPEGADLVIKNNDIALDDGLTTAVIISLFSDARARDDDVKAPLMFNQAENSDAPDHNHGGFWADSVTPQTQTGSQLWRLQRHTLTQATWLQAKAYAEQALQWLVDDKVVSQLTVSVEVINKNTLQLQIMLKRPQDPSVYSRYAINWHYQLTQGNSMDVIESSHH